MINSEIQPHHLFKHSVIRRTILSCIMISTSAFFLGLSNASNAMKLA